MIPGVKIIPFPNVILTLNNHGALQAYIGSKLVRETGHGIVGPTYNNVIISLPGLVVTWCA